MSVCSRIEIIDGIPRLSINGTLSDGVAYMTYFTNNNRYSDFAECGCRLFSLPVFFGDSTINENTHIPPFKRGLFADSEPYFSELDRDVADILAARPDAYIFPRVDVSLPKRWLAANPDELCDTGTPKHPESRRECFSSDKWAEEVKRLLSLLVEHIEASSYRDHIVGYQISGGQTQEWMAFDSRGSQGRRSREAFERYCEDTECDRTEAEYYAFLSRTVAQRIGEFAEHVKQLTDRRLVVGAFYGYTFELAERGFAHHALYTLLECDSIDFLCSPVSYAKGRALCRDHACMLPLESLKLHGKLYFSENDTRTHLTRAPNAMPEYNSAIWYGPDPHGSINVMKMHFSRALTHSHALWWFDMWGGWFASEKYMSLIEKMREIAERSATMPSHSRAELAVFIDENSVFTLTDGSVYSRVCYDFRDTLGACGAPYDVYLTADYETVMVKYKALISLVPADTPLSNSLQESAAKQEIPLLKINENNCDISTAKVRKFLTGAGVHVYSDSDAVIYANGSYLFLHTVHDGVQSLKMPHGVRLYEVFEAKSFPVEFESASGESYLFEYKKEM